MERQNMKFTPSYQEPKIEHYTWSLWTASFYNYIVRMLKHGFSFSYYMFYNSGMLLNFIKLSFKCVFTLKTNKDKDKQTKS